MNVTNETKIYWVIIKRQIEKKRWLFLKKDLIKLIVAFNMSELEMTSKDGFPYSNVWVKKESGISNNL